MDGLQPTIHEAFDDLSSIGSVSFAPDGQSIFVQLRFEAMDVWASLVFRWPELFGSGVGVAVLIAVVACVRAFRRPQRRGEPYCPRCNYHLSGILHTAAVARPAPRCPECGTPLDAHPPAIGRTPLRRVLPPVALALVLISAYATMLFAGVPRFGRVTHWFTWPSIEALAWARAHDIEWVTRPQSTIDRVVQLDLSASRRSRTVYQRNDFNTIPIVASPDGTTLYASSQDGKGIGQYDITTGRQLRSVALWPHSHPEEPGVLGFGQGGQVVYIGYLDELRQKDMIVEWNPQAGRLTTLVETPANEGWPGRALLLSGEAPTPRFLVSSNLSDAFKRKKYTIAVYSRDGLQAGPYDLPAGVSPSCAPTASPDASTAFITTNTGVFGVDLRTGEPLGTVATPNQVWIQTGLAISPDGRFLFGGAHKDQILIRDTHRRAWLPAVPMDSRLYAPTLTVSSDGRWLAAVALGAMGPQSNQKFFNELFVFDVSALSKAE